MREYKSMPIPPEMFSKRFGVRPMAAERRPDEMPNGVRAKLIPLVDEYRSNGLPGATTLGPALYERIGRIFAPN